MSLLPTMKPRVSAILSIGLAALLLAVTLACGGSTQPTAAAPVAVPDAFVINTIKLVTEGDHATASVPAQAGGGYTWTVEGGTLLGGTATDKVTFVVGNPGSLKLSCATPKLSATAAVEVLPLPRIESFQAEPPLLSVGDATGLIAVFAYGKGTVQPGNLALESGHSLAVSPLADTIYTLNVTNEAGGNTAYALNVKVVALPVIAGFSASAATVTAGDPVYLSATFTGGTGVVLPGNLLVENGKPVTVQPTVDTAYTLTVVNALGKALSQTLPAIRVTEAPSIDGFSTSASALTAGESAQLTATFRAGNALLTPGNLALTSGQAVTLTPAADTRYQLAVTNAMGAATHQSLEIKVFAAPAITAFEASRTLLTIGEAIQVTASFSGQSAVLNPGNLTLLSGVPVTLMPAADTAYTLTVVNALGKALSQTLPAIRVTEAPSIDGFSTSASALTAGESAQLTATFRAGNALLTPGNLALTSGLPVTLTPAADTRYQLTVTNVTGAATHQSMEIKVFPAPAITAFGASRTLLTAGEALQVTASFSGQSAVLNPGNLALLSGVPVTLMPTADTAYTLTVLNGAGRTTHQDLQIKVLPAQVIQSFAASASLITAGDPVTLTAQYLGGSAVLMPGDARVESGKPVVVLPITDTTYTLILTNELGKVSASVVEIKVLKAPEIVGFQASRPGVTAGETIDLLPTFSGGTGVITPGDLPALNGMPVSLAPAAATSYTLTVTNALGRKASRSVLVQLFPLPTISAFTAASPALTAGDACELSATFLGGNGLLTPGNVPIQSGVPTAVHPQMDTTYTLTVGNGAGRTATQTLRVQVVPAPIIQQFSAVNSSVAEGEPVQVTFGFTGGAGVITPGDLVVESYKPITLAISGDSTYTLTVTNALGRKATRNLSVNLVRAPRIVAFTVSPAVVTEGEDLTFSATYSDGTGQLTGYAGATIQSGTPLVLKPMGTGDRTYTLQVRNMLGRSASQSVTVKVLVLPRLMAFKAFAPQDSYGRRQEVAATAVGGAVQLVADFSGASAVINPGNLAIESGSTSNYGTSNWKPVAVTLSADTTYTLTVSNGGGYSVAGTLDLRTVPLLIRDFKAKPAFLTVGESSTLTWNVEGATSIKLDHAFGEVLGEVTRTIKPTETITYTLTALNGLGVPTTASATVTVVPRPVITSFVVESGRQQPGQPASLKAVFDAGPGGSAIIEGLGPVASGASVPTPALDDSRSYTLVVTNAAGVRVTAKAYAMVLGDGLDIRITGLPEGLGANVGVIGANLNRILTVSERIPSVMGYFSVIPAGVWASDGTLYQASPPVRGQLDWGGCRARVDVQYLRAETRTLPLPEGLSYSFILVPAGTYAMNASGQVESTNIRAANNYHLVTFARPFYMGKTEVTQSQWVALMNTNPSQSQDINENYPVGRITWDMAKAFVAKIQTLEGGQDVRLPSEAEWEYAARTGLDEPLTYWDGTATGRSQWPYFATSGRPDRWGLLGMNANATEWCEDLWHEELRDAPTDGSAWLEAAATDPTGPPMASPRVSRGRCDSRNQYNYDTNSQGFRLVMPGPPATP